MAERPSCSCHVEPMWRDGHAPDGRQQWRCAVKERRRNKTRIRIGSGSTLVGREHQFPAPREAVLALTRRLREESGLWPA